MAGKETGAFANTAAQIIDSGQFQWNPKVAKAYAEGRGGYTTNQHPAGSEASVAWIQGDSLKASSNQQFETDVG